MTTLTEASPANSRDGARLLGIAERILDAAVRRATGDPRARGRDAQHDMVARMVRAHTDTAAPSSVCMQGPTGTGKSLAYLSFAAAVFHVEGGRSVVATESNALLGQLTNKDALTVAAACADERLSVPNIAPLKGFANYVCLQKATRGLPNPSAAFGFGGYGETAAYVERTKMSALTKWAITDQTGDKSDAPCSPKKFLDLSIPSKLCRAKKCPFFDECRPIAARERAAAADIILTNDAMLAMRAVHHADVLPEVDVWIIDEAHSLPGVIRSQGSVQISGHDIEAWSGTLDDLEFDSAARAGRVLARAFHEYLAAECPAKPGAFPAVHIPSGLVEGLKVWGTDLAKASMFAARANHEKAGELSDAVTRVAQTYRMMRDIEMETPRRAYEAWLERAVLVDGSLAPPAWFTVPIETGSILYGGLWTTTGDSEESAAMSTVVGSEAAEIDAALTAPQWATVVALSATVPKTLPDQLGLDTREIVTYATPFTDAYQRSLLYIPADPPQDLYVRDGRSNRVRFDTAAHGAYATREIVDLVRENGGRALVLSSTTGNGKRYAEALERELHVTVHSQWGPKGVDAAVAAWLGDESSVLVGTRSLMTGLDARGDTCTLVIIDRVPRAAANPIDDARVRSLESRGINVWEARSMVYAVDAAVLLEQAAGRLVRSHDDDGVIAVLDPRLLASTPAPYPAGTRSTYIQGALAETPHHGDKGYVLASLQQRRANALVGTS